MLGIERGKDVAEVIVRRRPITERPEPAQKLVYPLDEVLLLLLCLGVLAGSETFVDIARFGDKKLG